MSPVRGRAGRAAVLGALVFGALSHAAPGEARAELSRVFRVSEGVRASLRESKENVPSEWVNRVEAEFSWYRWLKVMPFLETRLDYDNNTWSRMEAGGELGWQPFSWAYLGNALHRAWLTPGSDRMEWEVRTVFTIPLPWWEIRSQKVSLYALNEWTFDIEIGEGQRNEVGAGVRIPLPLPHFSTALGWRHVDIIHGADLDQFEGTLTAEF